MATSKRITKATVLRNANKEMVNDEYLTSAAIRDTIESATELSADDMVEMEALAKTHDNRATWLTCFTELTDKEARELVKLKVDNAVIKALATDAKVAKRMLTLLKALANLDKSAMDSEPNVQAIAGIIGMLDDDTFLEFSAIKKLMAEANLKNIETHHKRIPCLFERLGMIVRTKEGKSYTGITVDSDSKALARLREVYA